MSVEVSLCKQEGWEVDEGAGRVIVGDKEFGLRHPFEIHMMLYRDSSDPEIKFQSLKKAHDFLWPQHIVTWHEWTERRFRAHCEGYQVISMAGGASLGKSIDAAKIALLFWLSDSRHNAVIIASTTMESLQSRIWGYVMKLITQASLPLDTRVLRSKPPKVTYHGQLDMIHGMFATAIRQGDDANVLGTVIGRHPDKRLMVILDEATEMNPAITTAIPNWEEGVEQFQLWAIGNSHDKNDLHGALSTPRLGWESVIPGRDDMWETTQKRGICLYFYPWKSPAIIEPDYVRRILLGKFLITKEKLEEKKKVYGEGSSAWMRFVLGFWPKESIDNVIVTEQYLTENEVNEFAEWSGFYPLEYIAGLDPAFQVGGIGCKLRLGIWGQTTDGRMALDFRKEELVFTIDIQKDDSRSPEFQLAMQVVEKLREYNVPIGSLAIDATGVGRALGELIKMLARSEEEPFRVVSVRPKEKRGKNVNTHIVVIHPSELWLMFKEFVTHKQIKGIDEETKLQLTHRLVHSKAGKLLLEKKSEYKARMAAIDPKLSRSPDESDAMMLGMLVAIKKFGFRPEQMREKPIGRAGLSGKDLWVEKMMAIHKTEVMDKLRREKEEALYGEGGPGGMGGRRRPALVPNFSGSIEDMPSSASRFSKLV